MFKLMHSKKGNIQNIVKMNAPQEGVEEIVHKSMHCKKNIIYEILLKPMHHKKEGKKDIMQTLLKSMHSRNKVKNLMLKLMHCKNQNTQNIGEINVLRMSLRT